MEAARLMTLITERATDFSLYNIRYFLFNNKQYVELNYHGNTNRRAMYLGRIIKNVIGINYR